MDTQTIAGTASDTPFTENSLDLPSFTIEFLEHLSPMDWQHWLDQIRNTGAVVEHRNDRVFAVVCLRPQQLAHVGWLLFHSHLRNICLVVSAAGGAETKASAYPKPPRE